MARTFLILIFVFIAQSGFSQTPSYREKNETFENAAARSLLLNHHSHTEPSSTAFERRVRPDQINWSALPIESDDTIQNQFVYLRDLRSIQDPERADFLRRATWLYPDDGCWYRAEWARRAIDTISTSKALAKIFSFGDLEARTPNHPNGFVTWWYHTALVARGPQGLMVFDPALDAKNPMTLNAWVRAQSFKDSDIKVALCASADSDPYDSCDHPATLSLTEITKGTISFLKSERERLKNLNRNDDLELGDRPPWL